MQIAMDDDLLIAKAAKGDARSFEQLMRRHEGRMYSCALRMCGNREDAQDCVQEAMLRVFRALERFKGESSFSTWVYRITMNACLDELRRRKVRSAASLDTLLESGWTPKDPGELPDSRAERMERKAALEKAISELPEDMRAAIVLREVHDLSYEEISQALDVNVGTIKSRISRGRERLRQLIGAQSELFGRNDE